MRTKVTFVLLFLNVVLFFVIFRVERSWRTEHEAMQVRRRVLGSEAADIRTLDVTVAGGAKFSLARPTGGDTWFLVQPIEWRANQPAVSRILSSLRFLEHEASFTVAEVMKSKGEDYHQALADYGLDRPKLVVAFTSGGPETTGAPPVTTTLRIGDATQVGQRLYLLSPDGARIDVVDRELADSLLVPLDQLRADTVLTIPVFEARTLNLQALPAGLRVSIRRDGGRWSFETPIPARAAKDAVELAINNLDSLRVKSFVDPNTPAPPAELRVAIGGDNRQEAIFFGPKVPAAAKTAASETEYYAQLEDPSKSSGRTALFTVSVPDAFMETLRVAQESLRDRHVLDFDPAAVTGITLRANSRTDQPELTLQRDPGSAGEADWQIVLRGDGTQGPSTQPADQTAVQGLLDHLAQLSAQQFKTDAPQAPDLETWGFQLPERTITLTQQTSEPGGGAAGGSRPAPAVSEITLEIGQHAARDPLVYALQTKPSSQSVYVVARDILDETQVALGVWRDRLLSTLPAAARITGLKLTDLAENKVLLDWKPDQPAGPAEGAVADLLKSLRTLRAKSFSEESFAKSSPRWRWQLDAAIALPGGAGGDKPTVRTLLLAERTSGNEQLAGSAEFGAVFFLDQPFQDALWKLTYGARDPGEPPSPAHP